MLHADADAAELSSSFLKLEKLLLLCFIRMLLPELLLLSLLALLQLESSLSLVDGVVVVVA